MWPSFMLCSALLCSILISTNGHPFLLSQGSNLPSIFGASAPTPESHIADLRKQKSSRIRENLKLNEEDDDFIKEPLDTEDPDDEDDNRNSALPSLLQKKIGKILNKLQIISVLRGIGQRFPTNTNTNKTNNDDNDFDKDFKDFDFTENTNKTTTDDNIIKKEEVVFVDVPVESFERLHINLEDSKSSGSEMKKREYLPAKDDVEFYNKKDGASKKEEVTKSPNSKSSRYSERLTDQSTQPATPSIVVYFMELIGSAIGLAYGAVAQITNRNNN